MLETPFALRKTISPKIFFNGNGNRIWNNKNTERRITKSDAFPHDIYFEKKKHKKTEQIYKKNENFFKARSTLPHYTLHNTIIYIDIITNTTRAILIMYDCKRYILQNKARPLSTWKIIFCE